jgi:DNA-binding transcriptional LysR family regulator
MDQAFAEAHQCPRIDMEIASNETIKQAVAAGFGLGFLSAASHRAGSALARLADPARRGVSRHARSGTSCIAADRRLPRIAEAFATFLVEEGARRIKALSRA